MIAKMSLKLQHISFIILNIVFAASIFSNISDAIESGTSAISDSFKEESTDEILKKYVDISLGEFKITNKGSYYETSLEITVKNKANTPCSYYISIEAVDANGTRIETDMVYIDRLNAGQKVNLTAFEYVDKKKINQFKNAQFRILEINKYDS